MESCYVFHVSAVNSITVIMNFGCIIIILLIFQISTEFLQNLNKVKQSLLLVATFYNFLVYLREWVFKEFYLELTHEYALRKNRRNWKCASKRRSNNTIKHNGKTSLNPWDLPILCANVTWYGYCTNSYSPLQELQLVWATKFFRILLFDAFPCSLCIHLCLSLQWFAYKNLVFKPDR